MRTLAVVAAGAMALVSVVVVAPAQAATVHIPGRITAVSAVAGPQPGEVTFHWTSDGTYTNDFVIETALSSFAYGAHGRAAHTWTVSGKARSLTLTPSQLAAAGASIQSANHLVYRLKGVHTTSSGTAYRNWPYLQSVAVMPEAPATAGTPLRIASFNVRTAKAGDHSWLDRAPLVAAAIIAKDPGIVAVQELGPGRSDGAAGTTSPETPESTRQTTSLVNALDALGVTKYALVRSTSFLKPGITEGSQGARILYDTTKYTLLSNCPETSSDGTYSASCSITLPIRSNDSVSITRRSSYAEFQDIASGEDFWVASTHLDDRHSTSLTTEKSYEALRGVQMNAVISKLESLDINSAPIFIAGDTNSWQNNQGGDNAHDALIKAGFYDTAAAATQVNTQYTTFNDFATTIAPNPTGWGSRLDVIAEHGISGAVRFENVMKVTDSNRPSDHNMVVADVLLPEALSSSVVPFVVRSAYTAKMVS